MDAFAADDMDKKIDECIEKRPMGVLMVKPMRVTTGSRLLPLWDDRRYAAKRDCSGTDYQRLLLSTAVLHLHAMCRVPVFVFTSPQDQLIRC